MMKATEKDIGKRVVFKLTACNWPARKETRIIHDITLSGGVLVTHNGIQKRFIVRSHEILEII